MKALCNDIHHHWQKFRDFGLNVVLVTADAGEIDMVDLAKHQIVIATPEKFDAITRNWTNHREIGSAVRLVLIDEVHLVGDKKRGPTLEAIVSRIKTFPSDQIRFILASAFLSNIENVGHWISDSSRTFK